ncbi:MAG: BamA/TamA family outer membrane protein [Aquificaceae bacterium]|nr:BamA/TamA family outer membrane protein [Aquificaceae bacterium]
MLLALVMLFPLIVFAEVQILSNYPLKKNNFEQVINMKNYKELVEAIKNIEEVKDVYLMEEEDRLIIYIERYFILRNVYVRGNRGVSKEDILFHLGLREGMPVRDEEFDSVTLQERIERIYMDKGFLDVEVNVLIKKSQDGYVDVYIDVEEGPVYFTEGGVYKGATLPSKLLDLKIGLVKGRVFKESFYRESIFTLQDFYTKEGFWDSFVYYEGMEKLRLNRPFLHVLAPGYRDMGRRPLRILGALLEGASNLFGYPQNTLSALFGRSYVARPVFRVFEGRKYQVSFEGANFFNREKLLEITQLREKSVDPFSLEEAKENLLKAYRRKGFFDAEIDYKAEEGNITFFVREGERYKMFGEDIPELFYDEDRIESILNERIEALKSKGYILASGKVEKQLIKEDKKVKVIFVIDVGKKHIITNFVYLGKDKELKDIFKKHSRKLPAVFNGKLVEALNLDIQRYLLKKGFMDGRYEASVEIKEEGDSIKYTYIYQIHEGPAYKVGQTLYYGYNKTALRELEYMTVGGKRYSEAIDYATFENMINSGIFTGVSIKTQVDHENREVHRLIQVSEDQRGVLDLSLGYNTEEKITLEAFLGAKNLFGVSMSSGLRYRRSAKRELYDLSLQDDFVFSRKYWIKSNLFKNYEEHKSYNLDSYGFSLQPGYRLGGGASVGPIFSLLRNRVDGRIFNIRKQGLFFLRSLRDDPYSPRRFQYNSINFSFAEGDAHYRKLDFSNFYILPAGVENKISFKLALGAVWGDAPIFDRFFLGGLRDLRGYSFEEVGQPKGGRYYSFGRLEFTFPIREPIIGILFTDAGSVKDRFEDLSKEIKWNVGSSLGVDTPIGPIRLDVAFPKEKWHKNYKVYLSVGYYY